MNRWVVIASFILAVAFAGCASQKPVPNVPIPPAPPEKSLPPRVNDAAPPAAAPAAPSSYNGEIWLPGEEMRGSGVLEKPAAAAPAIQYVPVPAAPPVTYYERRPHHGAREYRSEWTESHVLPSALAGALIGGAVGPGGHRWTYAGRGALAGVGAGILLDMFSR